LLFSAAKNQTATIVQTTFLGAKISNRTIMNGQLEDILAAGFVIDNTPVSGGTIALSSIGSTVVMGTATGAMPAGIQARIYGDLREIQILPIASTSKLFSEVFGGSNAESVMRYLNERVKYIYFNTEESEAKDLGINAYNVDVNWWRSIYLNDLKKSNS
jgi:hypothetical protein